MAATYCSTQARGRGEREREERKKKKVSREKGSSGQVLGGLLVLKYNGITSLTRVAADYTELHTLH